MASKLDPDDVVQSVFRSFFRANSTGKFQLQDWDGLWALLAKITVRKCSRKAKDLLAPKRNCDRELSLFSDGARQLESGQPTPEQAAVLTDLIENLYRILNPLQRQVLTMKLQQFTNEEISERIDRTERTVYRSLLRIRKRLIALEETIGP